MMPKKLNSILKYAYEHVPFYKSEEIRIKTEIPNINQFDMFRRLPIVRKSNFLTENMLSNEYKKSDLIEERTSGTSGTPFVIYKTPYDRICQLKQAWKYRKENFGINVDDKLCRFSYNKSDKLGEVKGNTLRLKATELNGEIFDEFTYMINDFEPVWMFTTPSTLLSYIRYLKRTSDAPKLIDCFKYIELTGEKVFENVKAEIENFFKCAVGNNYGTTETYPIAMLCKKNHLHIIEDNVYVELIDENGNNIVESGIEGDIVVTSYNNTAMPFIRYRLGDRGMYVEKTADCGNNGKIIALNKVRFTQNIKLRNGDTINPINFYILIDEINTDMEMPIEQFHVKQDDYIKFTVSLVLKNNQQAKSVKNKVEDSFSKFLKNVVDKTTILEVKIIEHKSLLPNNKSGKLSYFDTF